MTSIDPVIYEDFSFLISPTVYQQIKVLDERHSLETSYFFDGVFGAEDDNERV